jgi:hypothetical protein
MGTLEPGATMLETSPAFGVTINKLEGLVMLEALSGVMLGGSTELGASRLIWLEKGMRWKNRAGRCYSNFIQQLDNPVIFIEFTNENQIECLFRGSMFRKYP